MDFSKFIQIVTEGGSCSEIFSIYESLVDYYKRTNNYDFWKEHINKSLLKQKHLI